MRIRQLHWSWVVIALALGCGSSSAESECRCSGALPEGTVDVACGQSQCIGGISYACAAGNQLTPGEACTVEDAGAGDAVADAGGDGASCSHLCNTVGARSCVNAQLRVCETDAQGCRKYSAPTACESGFCGSSSTCGTCSTPCHLGETSCASGSLRTCVNDANGCASWGAATTCPQRTCENATSCGTCGPTCQAARSPLLSAGAAHACMLRLDGSIGCWGLGEVSNTCATNGACGQAVPPTGVFDRVASGRWNTCGIRADGALTCWGWAEANQNAAPAGTFRAASMSFWHGCAVRTNGTLACWGDYFKGVVPTASDFVAVSGGDAHNCALRQSGAIECWMATTAARTSPAISPVGTYKQFSSGRRHNCAVRTDGTVACWGVGRTAANCSDTNAECGQSIPASGTFKQVAAGTWHTCGLRVDGTVTCWGRAGYVDAPTFPMEEISAGEFITCGRRSDGGVTCWDDTGSSAEVGKGSCATKPCTAAGATTCVAYEDGSHICECSAGYTNVAGTCVDATPCTPNPCTTPNKTECTVVGGMASCGCSPGFVADATGACVDATPCDPNPCTTANRTTCAAVDNKAVCSCSAGYAEDAGVCRDLTPCTPNPCTGANKTVCTADGFSYSCGCTSGYVDAGGSCVFPCTGGYHTDGDLHEPNECAQQATVLVATALGTPPAVKTATIAPLTTDVDFFRLSRSSSHVYWSLLGATAQMCSNGWSSLSVNTSIAPPWTHVAELPRGTDLTFSCARVTSQTTNPSYSLGAIDFDVSVGDYPNSGTPRRVASSWMSDTLTSGDRDRFIFSHAVPFTLRHQGRSVIVSVDTRNPTTGAIVDSITAQCPVSISPRPCITFDGSGTGDFDVEVSDSFEGTELTAYGFTW